MRDRLHGVRTDYQGFWELIDLYHRIEVECFTEDRSLELDVSGARIDANMCAPLGAVLAATGMQEVRLTGMQPALQAILEKNGFLHSLGGAQRRDTYGTTIQYHHFDRTDTEAFKSYLAAHFVGKGMPAMSDGLRRKFRESIAEIFDNAVEHSETEQGIFACGQYFPKQRRLDFTMADLGIGMPENIRRRTGQDFGLQRENAIAWAMQGENTTRSRREGRPGGLGLKLIREFVTLNGGCVQIVSDAGYWSTRGGKVELESFGAEFPGTVVNIEINTADTRSYCLESELLDPDSIF